MNRLATCSQTIAFFALLEFAAGLDCYKSNGVSLDLRSQNCNPVLHPYCLKANVYDGRVIRDCASAQQCPQGDSCAPITYEEDGTTDFVCCCTNALCNDAPGIVSSRCSQVFRLLFGVSLYFAVTKLLYKNFIY